MIKANTGTYIRVQKTQTALKLKVFWKKQHWVVQTQQGTVQKLANNSLRQFRILERKHQKRNNEDLDHAPLFQWLNSFEIKTLPSLSKNNIKTLTIQKIISVWKKTFKKIVILKLNEILDACIGF